MPSSPTGLCRWERRVPRPSVVPKRSRPVLARMWCHLRAFLCATQTASPSATGCAVAQAQDARAAQHARVSTDVAQGTNAARC